MNEDARPRPDPDVETWLANRRVRSLGTFYAHRNALALALIEALREQYTCWKTRNHHHADNPIYADFFLVGIELPQGLVTYHVPNELWNDCRAVERQEAPPFDGHTPEDVVVRLLQYASGQVGDLVDG